jgi:hypothetical protein
MKVVHSWHGANRRKSNYAGMRELASQRSAEAKGRQRQLFLEQRRRRPSREQKARP